MPKNEPSIDATHDVNRKSWVETANEPANEFPIQNLPYCRFVREQDAESVEAGVGIGDAVLSLSACAEAGLLDGVAPEEALAHVGLLDMAGVLDLTTDERTALRTRVSELLCEDNPLLRDNQQLRSDVLVPREQCEMLVPATIGDYTDFYASVHHATNVGSMFRPDNPLLPNYKHIPIGYHGRASTVIASGESLRRPWGQLAPHEQGEGPSFGPCKLFDYELEMGAVLASGKDADAWAVNERGERVGISDAEDHIAGLCLLNDWSARDIQKWEYQPLGPFLAKSFATTLSPWIVSTEALAPFRVPIETRPGGDPAPLPYLTGGFNTDHGGFGVTLEAYISSAKMRQQNIEPLRLSSGSFTKMYWTFAQMLTHHASNGCEMRAGDLLGSGTVSGPERQSRGCMLELTWDGDKDNPVPGTKRTPITLPTGEERTFVADGDEVILKGFCKRKGFRTIGFGECRGVVQPANRA